MSDMNEAAPPLSRHTVHRYSGRKQVLVGLAKAGDESAARSIVQRYNRRLFRVARAILRDDDEAEDVVQETYARAFTRLAAFRGEASLSTWLTRIAINVALGRRRARRPMVAAETVADHIDPNESAVIPFPLSQPSASPEQEIARRQVRSLLEEAIDELPQPFRIVFTLREIENLSTEETARHLSLKPETIKTRLHRARRMLRCALNAGYRRHLPSSFLSVEPAAPWMTDRVLLRIRIS